MTMAEMYKREFDMGNTPSTDNVRHIDHEPPCTYLYWPDGSGCVVDLSNDPSTYGCHIIDMEDV